jgi:hypothetical protein
LLSLIAFSAAAQTQYSSVTLAWNPVTGDDIVAYNIYYGPASRTYTNWVQVGDVTQGTVTGLCPGATYYIAITAINVSGLESDYSDEIIYTIPPVLATLQLHMTPAGQAVLDATGPAGQSYDVLAASSLGSWANLATMTPGKNLGSWTILGTITFGADGAAEFVDAAAAGQPSRFYRLRAQ